MSKEIIRGEQFAKAEPMPTDEDLELSEEQLTELSNLFKGIFEEIKSGELLEAKIVNVDSDGITVDIGYKSHGIIPRYEFSDRELKSLKPDDILEVMLENLEDVEGNVSISYEKAKAMRAWDTITKLHEEGKPVEGIVTHKVKGGLSVDIGIPAFLPGSQVDLQRVTDFDHWVGQTITAHILKINKKRGNVIISRRKYLHEQRSEQRKQILDTLSVGQVIRGTVKNITNYGVFIDIGGVDGLLHITDMTWGRIAYPSEMVRIGDEITVKVLSFDKDHEKISLGMKQLTDNPWEKLASSVSVGSMIKGKISSITDYGLFVEVEKGVEGLVHISEISWTKRIDNLHKHYKVGDIIEVVVVSFDKENRRMSLSIKQLEKNPWESIKEQFEVGQKVKGKITNITDFGIFVELLPGVDGLVHVSDLSWTEHIAHPSDRYQKGEEVEAVILSIDPENQRVSLGVKQLAENPWEKIEEQYPIGSIIEGLVSKITNFGAFVKLNSGIEGLIHAKDHPNLNFEEELKVGAPISVRVVKINKEDQKIALSLNLEDQSAPQQQQVVQKKRSEKEEYKPQRKETPKAKSLLQLELEKITEKKSDKDE